MAIENKKPFLIRGKRGEVWAEKTGIRSYRFIAQVEGHQAVANVFIGEQGDLQAHVDTARQAVAEQAVSEVEHLEREAAVD